LAFQVDCSTADAVVDASLAHALCLAVAVVDVMLLL
jgi:hypothetical protein